MGGVFSGTTATPGLDYINSCDVETLQADLSRVCQSSTWVLAMLAARPFSTAEHLRAVASDLWNACSTEDWLEAFAGHPRIGDVDALRAKFAHPQASRGKVWEAGEQAGAEGADEEVLRALQQANADYEAKFGFIFLVCASGKSAEEMLEILRARCPNEPDAELLVAAGEQDKITMLRLDKLLAEHA